MDRFVLAIFSLSYLNVLARNPSEYLRQFGYLAKEKPGEPSSMVSSVSLEAAIKEMQRIGQVPQTGEIDEATIGLMNQKRCGMGDDEIVRTHRRKRRIHRHRRSGLAKDSFVWPNKTISYRVVNTARTITEKGQIRRVLFDAINIWNNVSALHIRESSDPNAEIQIRFLAGPHGDGYPFDGRDAVLAHAFYPGLSQGGDIHLDDDENWGFRANPITKEINLEIVAAHEIGHSLGLYHSDHPQSIMYPYYRYDDERNYGLHYYDKVMIRRLYGKGNHPDPNPSDDDKREKKKTTSTTTMRTTTKRISTTTLSPEVVLDPCDTDVDAIGVFRQEIFIFKGDRFWRMDQKGELVEKPRKITDFWPEMTQPIDACVEIKDQALFFSGKTIFFFSGHRLIRRQKLSSLGLPDDLERVRLAYEWRYGPEAKYYIWSDDKYWKLDVNTMKVEVDYPREIGTNWKGVGDQVSGAFSWGKDLYFVGHSEMSKFSSFKMTVSETRLFRDLLRYCMPRAEALVAKSSRITTFNLSFLIPLLLL